MKKVAVYVEGGLGKSIAFTATLPKLKEKHEKVIVVSAYPESFLNNTNVWRNLKFGHPYIAEDYLWDSAVIKQEPYLTSEYRLENKHLIEAYCKVLDIKYSPDMRPQLFLNEQEEFEARKFMQETNGFILIHRQGGTTYYNPQQALNKITRSRDWPLELSQKFVDLFIKKYPNIKVVQIALPTEPALKNVLVINKLAARMLFPLMKYCFSFVIIDSFMNHTSAAFNKKGVVLFGGTDPHRLGYEHNINLVLKTPCESPFCHKSDFYGHLGGQDWQCPSNYPCMNHNPEVVLEKISEIIDPILKQNEPKKEDVK